MNPERKKKNQIKKVHIDQMAVQFLEPMDHVLVVFYTPPLRCIQKQYTLRVWRECEENVKRMHLRESEGVNIRNSTIWLCWVVIPALTASPCILLH